MKSILLNMVRNGAVALLVCMLAVISAGCTRNNGDIGPWFGTWQLMTIETDGMADADYESNIFWSFQNDVMSMNWQSTGEAELIRIQVWGTWEEADGVLFVNFGHSEDRFPLNGESEGYNIYKPYLQTHIPYGEVSELKIVEMKGSNLRLTYQPPSETVVYTYILKKRP